MERNDGNGIDFGKTGFAVVRPGGLKKIGAPQKWGKKGEAARKRLRLFRGVYSNRPACKTAGRSDVLVAACACCWTAGRAVERATSAAATTTTTAALFTGACFVDSEVASAEIVAV